jgi:hypothetical protein
VAACLGRDVSTIGAENRAPPGMGNSPIKADITEATVLPSFERRVKLFTSLSICPASFMILLINRMRPTISTIMMVGNLVILISRFSMRRRGPCPIKSPRTIDPMKRERLKWRRNLFNNKIRQNTENIFTKAGMDRVSFQIVLYIIWRLSCLPIYPEKFSMVIHMPFRINPLMVSGDSLAGPMVQTIFVMEMALPSLPFKFLSPFFIFM